MAVKYVEEGTLMVHTLIHRMKRSEDDIRHLMNQSLMTSGVIFGCAIVFLALYFTLVLLKG